MRPYLDLLEKIFKKGDLRHNRTGIKTYSLFGEQVRYDLRDGFPLVTTRKIHFKGVKGELLFFLKGGTSLQDLHSLGVKFWDPWADENGDLGPIYGAQWRGFGAKKKHVITASKTQDAHIGTSKWERTGGVDQIKQVIETIKTDPYSRRIIVSAWNPVDLPEMCLAPCHVIFQFNVDPYEGMMDLQLYQRSEMSAFVQ